MLIGSPANTAVSMLMETTHHSNLHFSKLCCNRRAAAPVRRSIARVDRAIYHRSSLRDVRVVVGIDTSMVFMRLASMLEHK